MDNIIDVDFPSYKIVVERFIKQGILTKDEIMTAINNTNIIADKVVGYDILKDKSLKIPVIEETKNMDLETKNNYFRNLVYSLYKEKIKPNNEEENQKYISQIEYELGEIIGCNMADYFIFNYNMIKLGREKYGGVLTYTGRGSSASYITCMLLGFSTIDRNKYSVPILPERFLTKDRILVSKTLPDIDYNTSSAIPFYKAQQDLIGSEKTYPMIALGRLKEKSAWKIYAKANGVEFEIANKVSSQIEEYEKAKKYDNEDDHIDDDEYIPVDIKDYISPEYWDLYSESNRFLGVVTDLKVHPCSYIVADRNVIDSIGLIKAKDFICVGIEGKNSEKYGYLKNDLLVVATVDLTDKIYKKIGIPQHTTTELLELTKNDDKTWDIYKDGLTIEVNQMAKPNTRDKGKLFNPRNITDLSTIIAGIRPSAKSIETKILKRENYKIGIDEIDNMLFSHTGTGSYLLYQESIMEILSFAGIPSKETYDIIKAISKKKAEVINASEQAFIDGMLSKIKTGNALKIAKEFWEVIKSAAAYGFNASHSLSVAFDSLYSAYLKAHYPFEFYSTTLEYYSSEEKRDLTKVAQLKKELKSFDISLESLKYGKNNSGFVIDRDNKIIGQSLSGVKGVNAKIGKEMYYLYNELKINNIVDLICEIKTNENISINKKHWSVLSSIKYFDTIDKYKKVELLPELYDILYKKQFKVETIVSINKKLEEMFKEHKVNPISINMEMIKKYATRETAKLTYIDNQKELIREVYNMIESVEYSEIEYILNTYKSLGYVGDDVNTTIMDVKAVSTKKGSSLLYNPITENEKWVKIDTTGLKKGMQVIIINHKKKGKEIEIVEFIKLGGK